MGATNNSTALNKYSVFSIACESDPQVLRRDTRAAAASAQRLSAMRVGSR